MSLVSKQWSGRRSLLRDGDRMALPSSLYAFQKTGVARLLKSVSLLLADDMGLGKTVQALVALGCLFKSGAVRRAIIICPTSLLANWRKEANKWLPEQGALVYRGPDRFGLLDSRVPILLTSFETITQDWRQPSTDGLTFFPTDFDLIIVDEAQNLKNPRSRRSTIISRALIPRRWALSGTPMENRPEELGSVFRFLSPNEFPDLESFSDYGSILRLRDRMMLRRSKKEVLNDLPEKVVSEVYVEMNPAQKSEYSTEFGAIRARLKSLQGQKSPARRTAILGAIQRLRRICVLAPRSEDSGKLDYLEEEMEKLASAGEKAVVFSTFANEVLSVGAKRLERFGVALFRGKMTLKERDDAACRFLNEKSCSVMLASTKAAGVGLNWTVPRHVYQLDLWWNPQVLSQAEDRVHRIGQTRGVIVKRLVAADSIEEGILRLLNRKQAIFDMVVQDETVSTVDEHLAETELAGLLESPVTFG